MIRPVKGVTVSSQSKEAEQNKTVNDFIRRFGESSILPRNYQENEALRKIFQHDDSDDQNDE